MKHTPGPWKKVSGFLIGSNGKEVVAASVGIGLGSDSGNGEREANGRLIAAAPELLESLQLALAWIDTVPKDTILPTMPGFDRDEINNIIIKAKME